VIIWVDAQLSPALAPWITKHFGIAYGYPFRCACITRRGGASCRDYRLVVRSAAQFTLDRDAAPTLVYPERRSVVAALAATSLDSLGR
jgi:hypothetical protein